jgi:AraC-like DNA-binding protein
MLQLNWIHIIILTTILASFWLGGVLLFSPYYRSRANRYLGGTFWIVSLMASTYGLLSGGIETPHLVLLNDVMWEYLFPVTLLFYFAISLDHPLLRSPWRHLLFFPFVLTLLINVAIDLDMDFGLYHWKFVDQSTQLNQYYLWEQLGLIPFNLGILVWIFFMLRSHSPSVPTDWFQRFWTMTVMAVGLWLATILVELNWQVDAVALVWGVVSALVLWTTYQGVLQFKLAEEGAAIRKLLARKEDPAALPRTEPTPSTNYVEQLRLQLEAEHWYRDPSLSRDTVARQLGISSGYLSQQFKAHSPKQSFTDLIAHYRVSDAQRLLGDEAFAPYSILAIGYEAGFNSKSAFYAAFKKATGMTPTAYRQQHGIRS